MTSIILKEARQLAMHVGGHHKEVMDALLNRLEKWESVFGHLGEPDEVGNKWHALSEHLEAAESECLEQARLNGMGAEREAALLAKLEAAEKDIAIKEEVIDSLATVIKRLDAQCDAAEKERDDVAQQLVQSEIGKREISEAHDALQVEVGKLKDLEVSRCVKINGYIVDNARLAEEVERLQAKITEMERQEPVAWTTKLALEYGSSRLGFQVSDVNMWGENGAPLYALPGAQPAPSVPMDVIADYLVSISAHLARRDDAKAQAEIGELLKMIASAPKPGASVPEDVMRDAERYRYLRARDDGTAGVGCWIEADGRVCDRGWLYGVQLDSAIDSFIEVLAAAPKPEAKP